MAELAAVPGIPSSSREEDVRERALEPPLRPLPRLALDQQWVHLAHLDRERVVTARRCPLLELARTWLGLGLGLGLGFLELARTAHEQRAD